MRRPPPLRPCPTAPVAPPAPHAVRSALLALALGSTVGPGALGAQPARAEPARADTGRADTVRADTGRADTLRTDTLRADAPARPAGRALRALVAAAAEGNRLPRDLVAYRAAVETEFAVAGRREDGIEAVVNVEQVATTLRWTRAGLYDQHVVGYRGQQAGLGLSLLSVIRTGWATPVLYGNRLRLRRDAEGTRGGRDSAAVARADSARLDAARADSARRAAGIPGMPGAPDGDARPGWLARTRERAARRATGRARVRPEDTLAVVHPLAADRDLYYDYAGGDTVATLRVPGANGAPPRTIPIVRVLVSPKPTLPRRAGLFRGELDLDASRHALVRMRGHYLVAPQPAGARAVLGRTAVQGFAYVEYVNAEHEGRFWLPAVQRLEFQVGSPLLGDTRAVLRIVSRFGALAVNDTALAPALLALDPDSVQALQARARRRLTYAPGDSLRDWRDWRRPLGEATGALHADDFADVAPDAWRPVGPPRVEPFVPRAADAFRFNRIEGAFTGVGARVRFRDALPGATLRVTGGWAWAEGTARGRVELERLLGARRLFGAADAGAAEDAALRARWTVGVRAGRTLDLTNDFRAPLDSGASLGALLGADPYDWVDRRFATLTALRAGALPGPLAALGGGARGALLRLELGLVGDRAVATNVRSGVFGLLASPGRNWPVPPRGTPGRAFRPNRGSDDGDYVHTALTLDLRPDVAAEFVRPGVGVRLRYERGDAAGLARGLAWQRAEARVMARRTVPLPVGGALAGTQLVLVARGDVGALWGRDRPPQQLFELGSEQNLPGYGYKEFAGDRAAVGRGFALLQSPWWRAPIRLRVRRGAGVVLPGVAPGLSVGVQSGAASASDAVARAAILRLGLRPDPANGGALALPAARPSDGVRTTINVGARFFGGAVFVGAARPVDGKTDRPGGWRAVLTLNQGL